MQKWSFGVVEGFVGVRAVLEGDVGASVRFHGRGVSQGYAVVALGLLSE